MVKNAIKREQSQACLSYAEREHFRRSQSSMVNGQSSMVNGQCLLTSCYLPPVEWFTKLCRYERVWVEQYDNYQKQTYRNRCVIDSPNGPLSLTLPVEKMPDGKCLMKDVRISDHNHWRSIHWHALSSSYLSSPFFEYYQDDFRPFYEQKWTFLMDFNEALVAKCCELIDLQPDIHRTPEYIADSQCSMVKNAIKREQSQACLSYAEREHFRRSQWSTVKNAIKREQSQACLSYAEREHFRRSQWSMADFRSSIHPKQGCENNTEFVAVPYYQVFQHKHGFLPNLSIVDLIFNMGPEALVVLMNSLL